MNKRKNKPLLKSAFKKYRETVIILENHKGEYITGIPNYERYITGIPNYERYVDGIRIPYGVTCCELCEEFYNWFDSCIGCCIKEDTGKYVCSGTPYKKFEDLLCKRQTVTQGLIDAAKAELAYLEDLYTRLYKTKIK